MLKELVKKGTLTGICIVIFFGILLLYWRTFTDTALPPETTAPISKTQPTQEVAVPRSFLGPESGTSQTEQMEMEQIPESEKTPDTTGVEDAIDFLETLEKQAENNASATEQQAAGNSTDLTQEELFELVREGVSYYDSLVESGSVDFFMQASSDDYPGRPRMPTGTWEGSFEFSDNRLRATVGKNVTYYDETFGNISSHDTEQFAYDGETFEIIEETRRGKRLTRRSEVVDSPFLDPRAWGWGSTDGKETLASAINQLENPRVQQVDWNGTEVYHVKGTLQGIVEVELWLNPEMSYRPERHIFFGTNRETISSQTVSDYAYQEVAPDLWFPKSGTEVTTITDLKTGIETDVQTRTIQFSNHRINEPIPPHRFKLDAPPGTIVSDVRTRETFTVE